MTSNFKSVLTNALKIQTLSSFIDSDSFNKGMIIETFIGFYYSGLFFLTASPVSNEMSQPKNSETVIPIAD